MVEQKQFADGSYGLQGDSTGGQGEFIPVNAAYSATSAATQSIFTASRNYIVKDISGRIDVAGTGGACTISVYAVPSGVAIAAGTLLNTVSFNAAGVANVKQTVSLATPSSALILAAGSSLGYVITGVATSAVGSLSVTLSPSN